MGLAKERGISVAAAARRLDWQRRAPRLVRQGRRELGARFGGVWIDPTDDRVKLGLTGGGEPARSRAREAAKAVGLAGAVDVVAVEHSQSLLTEAANWLAGRLVEVNRGVPWPLGAGVQTDKNRVELRVPRNGNITAEQRAVVNQARERYGDALRLRLYDRKPQARACEYLASHGGVLEPDDAHCDPPLRSGISIWSSTDGGACTGGFLARTRTAARTLHQLTAGHCQESNNWHTHEVNPDTEHVIGPFQAAVFDSRGDAGIIRVSNPASWVARAWVFVVTGPDPHPNDPDDPYPPPVVTDEDYKISSDSTSVVGMRLCTSGAFFGQSDCGRVIELNVTASYGGPFDDPVTKLGRANFCGTGGDSGAPVYALHVAYGLQVAGDIIDPCDTLYQGIRGAENLMNVNVSFEP